MILFPAVDIKDGQCVRLRQGKEDEVTVFSADPVQQASAWEAAGAEYLHVVDLDGAFSGLPRNFDLIRSICGKLDIPVQLGGGVRDLEIAKSYFDAGVARLIIGTLALERPEAFAELAAAFPGKIGVSLDGVDGRLKTRGWVRDSGLMVSDVLERLTKDGAAFVVYTDISRDGMHSGVNLEAMTDLCRSSSLPVIAAGGVHNLEDLQKLYPLGELGLEGAVSGRALYDGSLDFAEAAAWLKAQG
ncbi:MAG: phosphoribosylformimino-5-aminoimidazole carboxamide ribotide isomerase [Desulfovibrionales bacterium]|jgi:phosphoribosylformimino-5-aminoimidazole carboxamide ribotide isomerase|nr:phosphoribosylformimino-5-aminoimidazole carboxamide ribotide isomerase [Desulfovibrionales bacterium]